MGNGPLPSPQGLGMSHIFCWTPGAPWDASSQPQRGDVTKPRPPAWVKSLPQWGFASPERA